MKKLIWICLILIFFVGAYAGIKQGMRYVIDSQKDEILFDQARQGRTETIRQLLAAGANVNFGEGMGWTPLMIAAAENHPDTVRFLLDNGAHPNAQNQYGRTALHFATNYSFEPIVKLLLDYGADPTIQTYQNFGQGYEPSTPIEAALRNLLTQEPNEPVDPAAYSILKMLLHKTDKVNMQYEGLTPLEMAVRSNDYDFATYLLERGADFSSARIKQAVAQASPQMQTLFNTYAK